jgi:hypothetical protein
LPWRPPLLRGEHSAQAQVAQALVALDDAERALSHAVTQIAALPVPELRRCLQAARTDLTMHRNVITRRADHTWPKSS